jgi:matrixin
LTFGAGSLLLDEQPMRRAASSFLVLVTIGSLACGGSGSGTAPSASVSVIDGVTGSPVAGVTVGARPGDAVTIERAGYLRRDTIVPRDGIVSLWPVTVDETYVRTLVYSDAAIRNRLSRWPGTSITVPRDFPAEVAEVVRPWVMMVPSDAPGVTIIVDPSHPGFAQFPPDTIAFALRQISDADARILSAELIFKSEADRRRPGSLAHEVGHALGLQHSLRREDLMFPTTARTTTTFSADERVLLTMMYAHRRPGQVAPDNDQAFGQAGSGIMRFTTQ